MRAVIDRLGSDLTVNKRERPDAFLLFRQLDSLGRCDPRRSPRSIWSCRTRSWIAAVVTPSSTTAVMIYLPARESATALLQNSTGKGRGMGEASQRKPGPQAIRATKPWGTSLASAWVVPYKKSRLPSNVMVTVNWLSARFFGPETAEVGLA